MDRRAMLQLLAGAVPGFALDPEQLLWRPRQMIAVPATWPWDLGRGDVTSLWMIAWDESVNVIGCYPADVHEFGKGMHLALDAAAGSRRWMTLRQRHRRTDHLALDAAASSRRWMTLRQRHRRTDEA